MKQIESTKLFSGAGGLALKLHAAGFQHRGLYEWNATAVTPLFPGLRSSQRLFQEPSAKSKFLAVAILWLGIVCAHGAQPETVVRDGVRYFVWKATPGKVRVVWKDDAGKQLRDFPAAKTYLEEKGEKPTMLMNGGIFEPGGVPSGVMVQEGKESHAVNRKDGDGNFFMKPNGIFLISDKGARVMETSKFPPVGEAIFYAVQSGPILLEKGKVHPAFNEGSKSRLLRNGVGVAKDGTVVFAISDSKGARWPNLYGFAELFRSLGCEDALFLDGDISQMRFGERLGERSNQFGSVIGVVE